MKVLVTGGSGFLGSHLVPALIAQGNEVTSKRFDVRDSEACRNAVAGHDVVYHLAAKVAVKRSERKTAHEVNVKGTENMVQAALAANVKRFLHVSTVATVGLNSDQSILNENSHHDFADRKFPNFDSKIESEKVVLRAVAERNLDAVIVNPAMIFGAGDAKKAARKGNILAARGKLPFYTVGGLSIVAVEDVVQGMIEAMKHGRKGERYILSGENLTFEQVFHLYAKLAGVKPPKRAISTGVLRKIGAAIETLKLNSELSPESALAATSYHWFDHAKATRELNFHPLPAAFAIENSFRYMQENGYLK